jgi:hypothetical protein
VSEVRSSFAQDLGFRPAPIFDIAPFSLSATPVKISGPPPDGFLHLRRILA